MSSLASPGVGPVFGEMLAGENLDETTRQRISITLLPLMVVFLDAEELDQVNQMLPKLYGTRKVCSIMQYCFYLNLGLLAAYCLLETMDQGGTGGKLWW